MSESFSLKKLLSSPFSKLYWVKTIMFGSGAAFLLFVAYGVYKAYFKKPPDTQAQVVSIVSPQAGSTINFGQESKSSAGGITPFLEVFVEGTKAVYNDALDTGSWEGKVGVRLGVRF